MVLVGCKSNTAVNRGYKALTTRFNIYFNGNEAYKEGVEAMESGHTDDYSQRLMLHPVYKYVGQKEPTKDAKFERTLEKCKIALQRKSITRKPARRGPSTPKNRLWLQRAEYNPFMHNVWLLSGKAQFYEGDFSTAAATFWFTARRFNWNQRVVDECHIWMARIYAVQGYRFDAETEIGLVNPTRLSNSLREAYSIARAEICLCYEDSLTAAIPWLQAGRKAFPTPKQRLRVDYLTAQLLLLKGDTIAAQQMFRKVASGAQDFRTQINARIAATTSISKLKRMTWQARNEEYLDQIYCKLGDLALHQNADTALAIEYHQKAVELSTRNGLEKALAALHLGRLALDTYDYLTAQRAYSTVMSLINQQYPDYENISHLSKVLDELQEYAETVHTQDSLLALAALPREQLMKHIDSVIQELKRRAKEAEEKQQLDEYNQRLETTRQQQEQTQMQSQQPIVGNKDDSWYFYNQALVTAGKSQFKRLWGSRKPEDNWRRANKTQTILRNDNDDLNDNSAPIANDSIQTDSIHNSESLIDNNSSIESDPLTPEYHLALIPFTPEQQDASNKLIEEGLYNMGIIFNEKLENQILSIRTFEQLINRYTESEHIPEICFNIYLMYMRLGKHEQAELWRQRLLSTYPETKFSDALRDPDYIGTQRLILAQQDSLYRATYEYYQAGKTDSVHIYYAFVKDIWPMCTLMPKFMFLDALSYIQDRDAQSFQSQLEALTAAYPESDVSPLASLMVKGIHEGRQLQLGQSVKAMKWDISLRETAANGDSITSDSTSLFLDDDTQPHVLILAYNADSLILGNDGKPIEDPDELLKAQDVFRNNLLFEVAKFNFENYLLKDFDIEFIEVNGITFMVISQFDNLDELLDYHQRIEESSTFTIPSGVEQIDISDPNLRLLLNGSKTFQQYFDWVIETYGEE